MRAALPTIALSLSVAIAAATPTNAELLQFEHIQTVTAVSPSQIGFPPQFSDVKVGDEVRIYGTFDPTLPALPTDPGDPTQFPLESFSVTIGGNVLDEWGPFPLFMIIEDNVNTVAGINDRIQLGNVALNGGISFTFATTFLPADTFDEVIQPTETIDNTVMVLRLVLVDFPLFTEVLFSTNDEPNSFVISEVPEPATLTLLAASGLLLLRRNRGGRA